MSFLVLVGDDEPDVEMLRTDVRSGSRLCENVLEPRMRRIVFSHFFFRW